MQVRREEEGASAGGQRERVAAGRGSAAIRGDYVLPCSPPRSLSLRLTREREAGVRGSWVWPRTIANANAPTSLSNLLLFGLRGIGGSTDEGRPYPGGGSGERATSHDPGMPAAKCTASEKSECALRSKNERREAGGGERIGERAAASPPATIAQPPASFPVYRRSRDCMPELERNGKPTPKAA